MNNGDYWARRLSPDKCYECSCQGSSVDCSLMWCMPCDGVEVQVDGKCCPKCQQPGWYEDLKAGQNLNVS